MAGFNFDKWYKEKGKNHVTNVRVPVEGKEKPAQFRLDGTCDATIDGMIKLGKKQPALISCKYPAEETREGVGLRRRAEFTPSDFEEMLRGVATANKEDEEAPAPVNRVAEAEKTKNGQPTGSGK